MAQPRPDERGRLPRERTEELERASLSTWATLSAESKGREVFEDADPLRTAFQQDAERLSGSAAFRRLRDKTHIHLAPRGDGYRPLLDHTLTAARLARAAARALRLNEDLAEAIALGHDLGEPAFARVGEEALTVFAPAPFRANEQALRVVERLETLNLTWEVRDGILHSVAGGPSPGTLEGRVAHCADRIALAAGDLADALASGVVLVGDQPADTRATLGDEPPAIESTLLLDLVAASTDAPEVGFSATVAAALAKLELFLDEFVRLRPGAIEERARGIHCLRSLTVFYLDAPHRLPGVHRQGPEPLEVRVLDHIASLTDPQALRLFGRLLLPKGSPHRL